MRILFAFLAMWLIFPSCSSDTPTIHPAFESISESVYASGIVKSYNQYQVFATVNGIVDSIFVSEGDSVHRGDPIMSISNEAQRLNLRNQELSAAYADLNANQGKLTEAQLLLETSRNKLKIDSMNFARQKSLWQQQIGTKVELEQRELAFQNSKNAYYSALVRFDDLKRQLDLASNQSKNSLQISNRLASDYILRSEVDGIVYAVYKNRGELVGIQSPLAIIGDASRFVLEMQVDEYDITKIRKGLLVEISLDSYKGQVFEANVVKINPIMNERSKTFLVEAEFLNPPKLLYPNITLEANIVLNKKEKALLILRSYLVNDSTVLNSSGEQVFIKTGLKDYRKVEVLSGLSENDELSEPKR